MDDIVPPNSTASGSRTHRGTRCMQADDTHEETPSSGTPLSNLAATYGANPQDAISSTADAVTTAIQSLRDTSVPMLQPANSELLSIPRAASPIVSESSQSLCKGKRPVSSLGLLDDDQHSLLFSATRPPISSISATSSVHSGDQRSAKCSRTSGQSANASRQTNVNATSVALHAVDTSIRYLSNSIRGAILDPSVAVRNATTLLYSDPDIPEEYCSFFSHYFPNNSMHAVSFTSLPDQARIMYLRDLYTQLHPSDPGPSTSTSTSGHV